MAKRNTSVFWKKQKNEPSRNESKKNADPKSTRNRRHQPTLWAAAKPEKNGRPNKPIVMDMGGLGDDFAA